MPINRHAITVNRFLEFPKIHIAGLDQATRLRRAVSKRSRNEFQLSAWLAQMMARSHQNVAIVVLANKLEGTRTEIHFNGKEPQ
jgi:hypothetical protein